MWDDQFPNSGKHLKFGRKVIPKGRGRARGPWDGVSDPAVDMQQAQSAFARVFSVPEVRQAPGLQRTHHTNHTMCDADLTHIYIITSSHTHTHTYIYVCVYMRVCCVAVYRVQLCIVNAAVQCHLHCGSQHIPTGGQPVDRGAGGAHCHHGRRRAMQLGRHYGCCNLPFKTARARDRRGHHA